MIEILETTYTLKMTESELRAVFKAVQCLPLYKDQDTERTFDELSDKEVFTVRELRSKLDFMKKRVE